MKVFCVILCLLLWPVQGFAETKANIVADLAEDHIDITSSFTGEDVVVFGTSDQDGDVAIVIRGPESRVTVRKKKEVSGMWLNRGSVDFKHVPLFYAYAVSRNENRITDAQTLRNYGIGLNALDFNAVNYDDDSERNEFHESLIRTQQVKGFFPLAPVPLTFVGLRLFKARFYLPANVPVGQYKIEAYLFKDGILADHRTTDLNVAQAGMTADILNFSINHSFAYALLGLFMAISSGVMGFWMSRSQRT